MLQYVIRNIYHASIYTFLVMMNIIWINRFDKLLRNNKDFRYFVISIQFCDLNCYESFEGNYSMTTNDYIEINFRMDVDQLKFRNIYMDILKLIG